MKIGLQFARVIAIVAPVIAIVAVTTVVAAPAELEPDNWPFPQERQYGAHRAIIHAPQIQSWTDFKTFEALLAIEFFPAGENSPLLATARIAGNTELQYEARLVIATNSRVEEVKFAGDPQPEYEQAIRNDVQRNPLEIPLDIFLAALAEEVLQGEVPEGFSTDPPPIHVAESPTILLFVNGAPLWQPLRASGTELLVNANWPLLRDISSGQHYLLDDELWLIAKDLDGKWRPTQQLPAGLASIPKDGAHPNIAAMVPAPDTRQVAPRVIYTEQPAELILVDGKPQLSEIEGTGGLDYVSNTDSLLFHYQEKWYFLAAGRWFSADTMNAGSWRFVPELPDAFSEIPADHKMGLVRASVSGTPEARMAALEAMLPRENTVAINAAAGIEVSYDGEPRFEPTGVETVTRAVNTQYDVLLVDGVYYLCHGGAWYRSEQAMGPWYASAEIPALIYNIPPSSPAYSTTYVKVASSTSSTVTYVYTPAYTSTVHVVYGVPWYGTGWYYPPYVGAMYYPYYTSYGHGNFYNPNTGTYGSRSVAYGPYGGYSYNEAYNPNTGRYGYVETAWDGDEWASYGEMHNSRTGVSSETSRHYSEDKDRMKTERTLERGGESIEMERTTDYNDRWSETSRETSRGGESEMRREWDKNGNLTSSGTIEAGDGRTATVSGNYQDGQGSTTIIGSEGGSGTVTRDYNGSGVTREGSFENSSGETIGSSTQRQGNTTKTQLESSSGGSLTSVSEGRGRTTVGQSAEGDLYAGHDGNVYKKSDEGWQKYDSSGGGWNQVDKNTQARSTERSGTTRSQSSSSRDYSQLNRDATARRQGQDRFQQRQGSGRRGSMSRGGGSRRRGR